MAWKTRIWLGIVALFWLTMTVLLWRSQFGSQRLIGSTIPCGNVWQKMLTAPDPSTLEIRRGTNRIGYCRWRPEVGQELATGTRMPEDEPIEGMVHHLAFYTLEVDGNVALPDFPTRLSFSGALRLDTNSAWQTCQMRVTLRPDIYEVVANAGEQTVRLHVDAGGDRFTRNFRFSDFQNPQKLLHEFGGPLLPTMLGAFGVPLSTNKMSAASLGLRWEARNDSVLVGNNRVRAYRLQTKFLDRYRVSLFVSPVGEILRAELPGNIVLVNDQLAGLRNASEHD